ncbi:thiamine pyrophosphate-binding protein [Alphaproteobacteria bacterium LSUCC0684]
MITAAEQLIDTISRSGTDTIFSLSGNQIMSIFDAAIDRPLSLIHTRHEAGAVWMADGYARSSGKVGVALVTAGPGFTNSLGPLYPLRQSQSPVLLLSGDSPVSKDGQGPFQQLDQSAVASGLVKQSWRCTNAARLADDIAGAIALARSGRPGPVHLALPEDVLTAETLPSPPSDESFLPENMPLTNADVHSILSILDGAEAPLILTSPMLHPIRSGDLAARLMKTLRIPVITMQNPRGLNDPGLGQIKKILKAADRILLLDKDIDFTLASGDEDVIPAARVALIAAEAETIAQASTLISGRLSWGCMADPISAAETLLDQQSKIKGPQKWFETVRKALAERPKPPKAASSPVAWDFLNAIHQMTIGEEPPLLVVDGGEFGQWAQSVLPGEHMIINGLSGVIGGAIPQAIGAAMANPSRRVIAFMGDGTAGFSFMEIETARRLALPITFIIGNDRRWGAEVEIQLKKYGASRAEGCWLDDDTSYDRMAQALGAKGVLARTADEAATALAKSLKSGNTTVINCLMAGLPAPTLG